MTNSRKVWGFRVKGGSNRIWYEECLEKKRVVFGWSEIDFATISREGEIRWPAEEIKKKLIEIWSDLENHKRRLGALANVAVSYCHKIKPGDYVLMAGYGVVAIGEFTQDIGWDQSDEENDIANWRGVNWHLKHCLRTDLSARLQRSMKDRRTIFEIKNPGNIQNILQSDGKKPIEIYRESIVIARAEAVREIQKRIANYETRVGHKDFEKLVGELLRLETRGVFDIVFPTQHDEATHGADVFVKSDLLDVVMKIQVKEHSGQTDEYAVNQILKNEEAETGTIIRIVASSAKEFTEKAREIAKNEGVLLWDGATIAELILKHFPELNEKFQSLLGLASVPRFVDQYLSENNGKE